MCIVSEEKGSSREEPLSFSLLPENFKLSPLPGKIIYLTRHGESEYNIEDRMGGDSPLSSRGIKYARHLSQYFSSESHLEIWTSCLQRTITTSSFLSHFPQRHRESLNEIQTGILDGLSYFEFRHKYPLDWFLRQRNKWMYRYPGGESYQDLCSRLSSVIREIETHRCTNPKSLLIVSHQAILRILVGYFLHVPTSQIPLLSIPQHVLLRVTHDESLTNKIDCLELHEDRHILLQYKEFEGIRS